MFVFPLQTGPTAHGDVTNIFVFESRVPRDPTPPDERQTYLSFIIIPLSLIARLSYCAFFLR